MIAQKPSTTENPDTAKPGRTVKPDVEEPGPGEPSRRQKIQQQLDEALAESFPASDPVSIVTSQQEEDWD